MFAVQLDNTIFDVVFVHKLTPGVYLNKNVDPPISSPYIGNTRCLISNRKTGDMHGAVAYCSPRDAFDRNKGRKVSLAKALKGYIPTMYKRYFWDAYYSVQDSW